MDSTPVYNLAGRVSATQRSKPTHSAHPTNSMLVSAVKQSRLLSGSGTVQCTHPVFSMMVQILPANLFRSALPTAASLPSPLLPLCLCCAHGLCRDGMCAWCPTDWWKQPPPEVRKCLHVLGVCCMCTNSAACGVWRVHTISRQVTTRTERGVCPKGTGCKQGRVNENFIYNRVVSKRTHFSFTLARSSRRNSPSPASLVGTRNGVRAPCHHATMPRAHTRAHTHTHERD